MVMRRLALFCLLTAGCEGYVPRLCQPCTGLDPCGPGLDCFEGFCVSPANQCEEERGVTPYFPDRDGVCDLLEPVGPVDTSKLVLYRWSKPYTYRQSVLVGLPGAAAPGTPRVAVKSLYDATERGDAWVHSDGSFKMDLWAGESGGSLGEWYPVDDDGDICGPKRSREEVFWSRTTDDGIPDWGCSATGPSGTLRCIYRDGSGWTGPDGTFEEWCATQAGHPSCRPPGGQLCAVTSDCLTIEPRPPFPHEAVRVAAPYPDLVRIASASLPLGSLLAAHRHGRGEEMIHSVVGIDDPLSLLFDDGTEEWRVWVERPDGHHELTSGIWVLTASAAAEIAGVDDDD